MRRNSLLLALLVLLPVVLVLTLRAWLGAYSRFMADDFCSAYDAGRFSLPRYIWYWYITWGGRYSAIASDFLLRFTGDRGMRLVPAVVLLLWAGVTSLTAHQVLRAEKSLHTWLPSLSLGSFIVFAVLLICPRPEQVLYWWNGMRTYIPGLISFTLHLGLLAWGGARLAEGDLKRPALLLACLFSFGLALFTGGFNETFTSVQFAFFSGLTLIVLLLGRLHPRGPGAWLLYGAILGSAAALVIMAASPGAANRQAYFPAPPPLPQILGIALQGYASYLAGAAGSPAALFALAGLVLFCLWLGRDSQPRPHAGWLALLSLAGGFFLAWASLLPSVYGTSEMPAARTFVVPSFMIVLGAAGAGLYGGKALSRFPSPALSRAALTLAAIALWASAALAAGDLYRQRATYSDFAARWDRTDAQIVAAREAGADSVSIAAPQNWAGLEEPNSRPKYWVTACYTHYYGIQVLGPDPDAP